MEDDGARSRRILFFFFNSEDNDDSDGGGEVNVRSRQGRKKTDGGRGRPGLVWSRPVQSVLQNLGQCFKCNQNVLNLRIFTFSMCV